MIEKGWRFLFMERTLVVDRIAGLGSSFVILNEARPRCKGAEKGNVSS
jgi:hypothetical protein